MFTCALNKIYPVKTIFLSLPQTNTFQLVIANDGLDSYALFLYPQDGINWLKSEGKTAPDHPDPPAQAGFDSGDRRRYLVLPGSGYPEISSISQYVFHDLNFRTSFETNTWKMNIYIV